MSDGIYSALSGAIAQQRNLDVVANNVANANTTGFKADRIRFEQVLAEETQPRDGLAYTLVGDVTVDHSQGSFRQTGNPLDVALEGPGFLTVETPQGPRYTRNGSLVLGASGVLQTQGGHPVLSNGAKISIPPDAGEIRIAHDGTISSGPAGASGEQILGQLTTVEFGDSTTLKKEGSLLFQTDATPGTSINTRVVQGHIETSNINAVAGVQELITIGRSFDVLQRVIRSFQEIDQRTARDVGGRG